MKNKKSIIIEILDKALNQMLIVAFTIFFLSLPFMVTKSYKNHKRMVAFQKSNDSIDKLNKKARSELCLELTKNEYLLKKEEYEFQKIQQKLKSSKKYTK